MPPKKIVVVGPESTGKSTLCEMLAAHYKSAWVEEYAREYLLKNGTEYTHEDLYDIALGQIKNEESGIEKLAGRSLPLFIDTDMYVMKVWSEFVFDKCDNRILTEIAKRKYDGYLLCNTDLPWVKDELREYPDLENRQKLYHYYHDLLVNQHVPWRVISGESYEGRFEQAVKAVNDLVMDKGNGVMDNG